MIKIMKLMIPFTPHLAHECLEVLNCTTMNKWPKINKLEMIDKVKFVVQINGKMRDILDIKRNLKVEDINKIVNKDSKAKKFLKDKKIIKTIFVNNKIINYII